MGIGIPGVDLVIDAGSNAVQSAGNALGIGGGGGLGVGDILDPLGLFGGGGAPSPATPGSSPTSTMDPALIYMSENNKAVALAQIQAQEAALQQASMDRQLALAANLELGLEKLDTKFQIAKLDFFQQMTALQNSNQEKLAKITAANANYDGLPPPSMGEG